MSRNFITAVCTIGVGVFTGYYTFQPALQELAIQRAHGNEPGSPSRAPSSDNANISPAQNPPAPSPKATTSEPEKSK